MTPYETLPIVAKDTKMLQTVVREAFSMRRKTIRNTLKKLISAEQLEALGIDTQLRPEVLTLEDYVRIADAVLQLSEQAEKENGTE